MKADPVWYFAFGANMASRVLAARRVTPLSSEAASLPGYRLVFEERGLPVIEPAFASITRAAGETVHGVLMRLERADFDRIDATEGPAYALLEIDVAGRKSGAVTAIAFQSTRPVQGYLPSRRYLRILCDGAREHGLPGEYIRALEAQPSVHVPGAALFTRGLVWMLGTIHRLAPGRRWRPARRRIRG